MNIKYLEGTRTFNGKMLLSPLQRDRTHEKDIINT